MRTGLLEPDLQGELDRAVARIATDRHHLRRLGISVEAEAHAGFIGAELIQPAGRLYLPHPAGFGALILAVWSGEPPSALATRGDGVLLDLLAFNTGEPGRWWRRMGIADAVLGAENYHVALDTGRPIALHPHPLAWLQAECRGACPVEWLERCRSAPAASWAEAA